MKAFVATGLVLGVGFGVSQTTAVAADLPVKAPAAVAVPNWTGLYLGTHIGYMRANTAGTFSDAAPTAFDQRSGTAVTGLQAGVNMMIAPRWLAGVEIDASFGGVFDSDISLASVITPRSDMTERLDVYGSLRGRLGYLVTPSWLVYATGGLAYLGTRVGNLLPSGDNERRLSLRPGWVAGAGVERMISPHWTARVEYLNSRFEPSAVTLPSGNVFRADHADIHTVRLGLNRKFDGPWGPKLSVDDITSESPDWEIHGQTTFLSQGYPSFRAPYSGVNSLSPQAQLKSTWSNSLFVSARVWEGGTVYFNPELTQGYGLSDTVGLAGFSSGEAQKSNFPYPRYNTSRLYVRQTFGFGGEEETLESAPGQFGEKVDVSRLTLQAGKFSVLDVFDGNSYAKDPRKDFMNWSVWAPGAFDYAADKLGLTYGATAELNQKQWALRAGYFLVNSESNSSSFDTRVGERGSYVLELETRYSLLSQPGKLRLLGFLNSAYSGSYRETLDNPAFGTDIALTRKGRIKYGYAVSVEQALSNTVGLFGRWSWNDGRTEIMAFTDIDASLSLGTSIKGASWGRPDDTIGIAGAINGLSKDHRDFIAAGGLGPLIGDGKLNYRHERILEAYYAYALNKGITLTANYQYVTNPAYNADRGPVSIFSGRLHGEF